MPEQLKAILSTAFMLIMFIGVLFLAYYATKFIGKRYSSTGAASGNIKILDRVYLGQDRSLIIVETGGKTMLIGATSHHIDKICDLNPELLNKTEPGGNPPDFSSMFKTVLKKNWGVGSGLEETNKENSRNA